MKRTGNSPLNVLDAQIKLFQSCRDECRRMAEISENYPLGDDAKSAALAADWNEIGDVYEAWIQAACDALPVADRIDRAGQGSQPIAVVH